MGDLDIATGNLALVTDEATETSWKLASLFGMARGEFFGDARLGFPWLQYVFVKNPNLPLIMNLIRRVCKMVPTVAAVTGISATFDPRGRSLSIPFTVSTVTGATIHGGLGQPFLVGTQGAQS